MADFSQIIQEINEDIKINGKKEITGAKLNKVLNDMISSVNEKKEDLIQNGLFYGGVVKPNSSPFEDKRFFYIADMEGEYPNFDGLVLSGNEIIIIKWDENLQTWNTEFFGVTQKKVEQDISSMFKYLYGELGFDAFSPFANYSDGDYVFNPELGGLYRFNTSHQGEWDDGDVEETSLVKYIDEIKNA